MATKPFDDLSPAYRERLIRAARTGTLTGSPVSPSQAESVARRYHLAGDLRAARGHAPKRAPAGAAPKVATANVAGNRGTARDDAALASWRRSRRRPAWIPSDPSVMGNDTAAQLSQIDLPPRQWREANIVQQPDGSFALEIVGTRGQRRRVENLDRDQVSEIARLLNAKSRIEMAANNAEAKKIEKEWKKPRTAQPLKVNFSYGRTATAQLAAKTPEELFGRSRPPSELPPPPEQAGKAQGREERPRARKAAQKAQPAKKAAAKKGAPVRKATKKRSQAVKKATRRPAQPLGVLDDVFAAIDEALSLGEVDTDQAIALLQAQIDQLRRGR